MHVVQFHLGHQSISTTVGIYSYVMKEADLVGAESLARIVSPDVGRGCRRRADEVP